MVSTKPVVDISVVSDTVCPWCYVGRARMRRAIAQFSDRLAFRVRWMPFQLNPGGSEAGEDKMEMYNRKFGAERVAAMVPMMARTFAEENLPPYRVEGLTGSTRNSHRLMIWAAETLGLEAQDRLAEKLFEGYFTQARFINDRAFLLEAVESAGLPADAAAREVLDAPTAYQQQLQEELRRFPGVTGVPHFEISLPPGGGGPGVDRSTPLARLGGAQPPEAFAEVFEAAAAMAGAPAPAGPGGKGAAGERAAPPDACGLNGRGQC